MDLPLARATSDLSLLCQPSDFALPAELTRQRQNDNRRYHFFRCECRRLTGYVFVNLSDWFTIHRALVHGSSVLPQILRLYLSATPDPTDTTRAMTVQSHGAME